MNHSLVDKVLVLTFEEESIYYFFEANISLALNKSTFVNIV